MAPRREDDVDDGYHDVPGYRATVLRELDQIHADIKELARKVENGLTHTVNDLRGRVTRLEEQIDPLKKLVWSVVGTILTSVVVAVLALIIKSGGGFR